MENKTTTGSPKKIGAVYKAPIGTKLPTDAASELDADFVNLGYVSDDGVKIKDNISTETIKAWGGDVVATPVKEHTDEVELSLINVLDVNVLKTVYGSENVTGDLSTGIEVHSNMHKPERFSMVIDTIEGEDSDVLHRMVYPVASLSDVGDRTYKDDELVAYDTTFTGISDDGGNTHHEYYKKKPATTTETGA